MIGTDSIRRVGPLSALLALAGAALAQSPTAGFFEYRGHFKVQKPYDIPLEQRFSDSGGMYTTWVYPKDKPFEQGNTTAPRTEMRWDTWVNQNVDNMFEADVMYEPGCAKTCIMQVKSNTSGEAVYLRVLSGGDLIWLGAGATILKGYYGKWFNLKAAFNPATAVARVWIDDQLKFTHRYNKARDWYFKNGTYTVEGTGPARAHFRNIRLRAMDPSLAVIPRLVPLQPAGAVVRFDAAGRLIAPGAAPGALPRKILYVRPPTATDR